MGLPRGAVNLLCREASKRPFSGSICTLGRQHVYLAEDELRKLAAARQLVLADCPFERHLDRSLAEQGFISDGSVFSGLGFSEVCRLDYSDYEAPDILFDLNQPETPADLQQRFDVVLDSGTLEHIFDVPAGLRHCARMVRPGGRIIHFSPTSNCVDHGMYSLSPTLFMDFYTSCGFAVEEILLCRLPKRFERGHWRIYEYPLDQRRALPLGRLDGSLWMVWVVVTARSAPQLSPVMQSAYVATWRETSAAASVSSSASREAIAGEPADSRAGRLLALTQGIPLLDRPARQLIRWWRRALENCRERLRGRIPFRYMGRV